jgi:hypothetical protein
MAAPGRVRAQAARVKVVRALVQLGATDFGGRAVLQSEPHIMPAQLVLCVGGLDGIGPIDLVCHLAGHQESDFDVARPAGCCRLLAQDNERRDIARRRARQVRLEDKLPVFLANDFRCCCKGQAAGCTDPRTVGYCAAAMIFVLLATGDEAERSSTVNAPATKQP